MVNKDNIAIHKILVEQWNVVRSEISRMHQGVQIRPDDIDTLLRPMEGADPNIAYFRLRPVIFNLPERATHSNTDLFVVVEGTLSYQRAEFRQNKRLFTDTFSTRAAYFRRTHEALLQVFGVHYDYSRGDLGHPAFHGQMKSFLEFGELVNQHYHLNLSVQDGLNGILNRVRVPTAQMDVFSVFLQMCADHLLHQDSNTDEVSAFGTLLAKSRFCVGAAFQLPRLSSVEASNCYRARHWYPVAT